MVVRDGTSSFRAGDLRQRAEAVRLVRGRHARMMADLATPQSTAALDTRAVSEYTLTFEGIERRRFPEENGASLCVFGLHQFRTAIAADSWELMSLSNLFALQGRETSPGISSDSQRFPTVPM